MSNFFDERLQQRGQLQTFSVGRKIRVGTKSVSKRAREAAQNNPAIAAILKKVDAGQVSFKDAEKQLDALGCANPFYPRNTPEFHAHPWDMGVGSAAITEQLLSLYGEMREGDAKPKLYRFPVVFPEVGGKIDALIKGGLSVQGGGANTIRYWSDYDDSGARVCKHLPPVVKHEQAQRGKVLRKPERQPVTRGLCNTETCVEFASGMCKFNGTLQFYIPGVAGAGVFQLGTGSTQAATDIYLRLSEAIRATNGQLKNYDSQHRPVFWLSKEKVNRPYFDAESNAKVSEQWVPRLEMNIEMPKVLWLRETGQLETLAAPTEAKAQLGGSLPVSAAPSDWVQGVDTGTGEIQRPTHSTPATDNKATQAQPVAKPAVAQEVIDAVDKNADPQNAAQQGAQSHQSPDTLAAMNAHAAQHGYDGDLATWVAGRFGGDTMAAALTWSQMVSRFGERTKDYVGFLADCTTQKIDAQLALKYFHSTFGPLGSGVKLVEMRQRLKDLCADGASVAIQVMEEAVSQTAS